MNVGVFGASGNIGQRIVAEAREREHHVTAFTRHMSHAREVREGVTWKVADILDAQSVAGVLGGLDVLVSCYQPGNASRDFADTVQRSIADPGCYARAARATLAALETTRPSLRVIVVGGAGSLEVKPGLQLADAPDLPANLAALGLPSDYAVAVRGHREALNVLRLSNRRWTYFSPAEHIEAGERTGRFRLGGDRLVVGADGRSRISYEDFAVALVDEIETPRHIQRRFTIGY
jgi:putative NADH-flavin reductase